MFSLKNFFFSRNFQLSIGRKMLGRVDGRNEVCVSEQRQAFSSLKAIKAGKKVGSIRTGHRVRDYTPGAVPQQQGAANQPPKSNGPIQIYEVKTAQAFVYDKNFNVRCKKFKFSIYLYSCLRMICLVNLKVLVY